MANVHIKNTVCKRCIMIIKEEAGFKPLDVKMGELEFLDNFFIRILR